MAESLAPPLGIEELETRRVLSVVPYLHPDGNAFQIPDTQFGNFVAADGNGNSIVTWEASPSGSSGTAIYAQQFSNQGQALGSAFVVAGPLGSGSLQSAGVVADSTGDFVVLWDATAGNGISSLEAQRYNLQGAAVGTTLPLPGNGVGDRFSLDATGNLLVVYGSNISLYGQRYDPQNNLIGPAFLINPTVPGGGPFQLAADSSGDFMVSWFENSSSAAPANLYARGYNNHAVAQTNEFLVVSSSDTTSAASPYGLEMAGYGSGDFLIQWQNQSVESQQRNYQPVGPTIRHARHRPG